MCMRIYIFNSKKTKKSKQAREKNNTWNEKRRKENISRKSTQKNRFVATRVKIFLVTHISGKKVLFWSYFNIWLSHSQEELYTMSFRCCEKLCFTFLGGPVLISEAYLESCQWDIWDEVLLKSVFSILDLDRFWVRLCTKLGSCPVSSIRW